MPIRSSVRFTAAAAALALPANQVSRRLAARGVPLAGGGC